MPKRSTSDRDDPTHPEDIPTAVIEHDPFGDDTLTVVEGNTESGGVTPTSGSSPSSARFDKFRRPTPSEIAQAVDAVNTEAVDMAELARARALEEDEDEEDAG